MRNIKFLITMMACVIASVAGASTDAPSSTTPPIENSYIVTFKPSDRLQRSPIAPPATNRPVTPPPFGEHSTGQSKDALAAALGVRGRVASIFESINAAHLQIDEADAERLRRDPRVLRVEQDMLITAAQTVQQNPGWALDRLDQTTTLPNSQYIYNANGAGRTIYVLDTGLDLRYPAVAAEFGGRASVYWDVNGAGGYDCHGHGTQVASAAAGSTRGIAKGANVIAVKITTTCTRDSTVATATLAFNWLAVNAPKGTIANFSYALSSGMNVCDKALIAQSLDDAIGAAYRAGIIAVVAAGNDNCNTANYSPTRIPEAFVVGATDASWLLNGRDARSSFSRVGNNISTFAPGTSVALMNYTGAAVLNSGTSFSAPYMAGMFAVGCQAAGTFCNTMSNAGIAYAALRNLGTLGTVINADGTALPVGTPSRFVSRLAW